MSISKGTPLSSQIVWFEQRLKEVEAERDSATLAEREAILKILNGNWYKTQSDVAAAIRARGDA